MSDFGIYIHWPFCISKCPYCDFFSKVKKDVPQEVLIDGYLSDLDFYHGLTSDKTVTSIFFGGGTPSLIKPELIQKLINHIAKRWSVASKVEVSLEANPNSERPHLFEDLRTAGINRLSLGVQALNDTDLKFLGRTHNLAEAMSAADKVLNVFDNHSMDLIYARPKQTVEAWQQELTQAAGLGFKHLSLYQLTIEEGTVFYKKGLEAMEEEIAAEMYALTNDFLAARGYGQYEISNYALEGFSCRHNRIYWTGDDYLGIGQGAHGRVRNQGKIYATTHCCQLEELSQEERAEELILMGLRLNEGINKKHFQENSGIDFDAFVNQKNLHSLTTAGLLTDNQEIIKASDSGRLLLNKLIEELCS